MRAQDSASSAASGLSEAGDGVPGGGGTAGAPGLASADADVPVLSRQAVAVCLFGLLSFFIWPFTVAIVLLGPGALRRIRSSGGRLIGREWALTGIVAAWIALVLWPGLVFHTWSRPTCDNSGAWADISTLNTAIMGYKNNNRAYPSSLNDLVHPPAGARVQRSMVDAELLTDAWGQPYRYQLNSPDSYPPYTLRCSGPDRKDGTADDLTFP